MIQGRTQQQMTTEEENAVRKFFREHPELGDGVDSTPSEQLMHNATEFEKYLKQWNVVVNEESLQAAYEKLRAVENILKITSQARMKYAEASRGYTQAHQDVLDAFLRQNHLVHDPADDRTYENCTALFGAMRGREFTADNLSWCLQYLQGRGGRGTKLHWEERPSQIKHRAHIPTSQDDFRFAPREDSNQTPLSRHSHASDPRFNGQLEREKMKRPGQQEEDVMATTWMLRAQSLAGNTHSESKRIQDVVRKTPGGWKAAYEAGLAEQRTIENERARGR